MNKIKVLNVISDTNIGGAGKCIITFAKNYNREKFDLRVVVPKGSKLVPELENAGVKVIQSAGFADKSFSFSGIKQLKKIFSETEFDVVHAHGSLNARIAARLAGAKAVIYTLHCVYEPSGFMKSPIGKLLNKTVAALFSDKIIAVAQAAADNLTAVGINEKKIRVILNGITPLQPLSDEEKAVQRERFGVRDGQKVVSLVARLETVKGHDDFISAAKKLHDKNICFIAAGNGSREEELKDCEYVNFTGFIPDAYNLMGITDLSVNASFGTEATSISLLEGMSLGIPAVVTNYGGNPGVIKFGENGFLVPTHDGAALADKIYEVLSNDTLYNKLSDGAKRIFGQNFTAESYSRQIEKVYTDVLNERKTGHGKK